VDGYTTLAEVYHYAIEDTLIQHDLDRGEKQLAIQSHLEIAAVDRVTLNKPPWSQWSAETDGRVTHPHSAQLEAFLRAQNIPYTVKSGDVDERILADRQHQLAAVKRWYHGNWQRLDNKLRSSIVEGIVVFLSLFDDNPALNRTFCPPKSAYTDRDNPTGRRPLPPLETILESGKVLALNFPVSLNPGLARALGVMLKLDFQRAVLSRVPRIAAEPERQWRDILFVCDEYHAFATTGETDPTGDERTFALSRQARLIPIVATQSISSLRSALHGDESWRTLLQCFRTKIFLASADEYTARIAADLCGKPQPSESCRCRRSPQRTSYYCYSELVRSRAADSSRAPARSPWPFVRTM
jgi:TraM recognition site of TraD and TraG